MASATNVPVFKPKAVLNRLPMSRNRVMSVRASGSSQPSKSNVIMAPKTHALELVGGNGLTRKQMLELEARRDLEEQDSWHNDPAPSNIVKATSPKHFKSLIVNASPTSIIVVDFFSPSCNGCRSLWPKLKQIAGNNKDITFVKINTSQPELAAIAEGFAVSKMPWFLIFQGGSNGVPLSSFTANVSSVDKLRAEIAASKDCTVPQCLTD